MGWVIDAVRPSPSPFADAHQQGEAQPPTALADQPFPPLEFR
jgi:hypothetical protein